MNIYRTANNSFWIKHIYLLIKTYILKKQEKASAFRAERDKCFTSGYNPSVDGQNVMSSSEGLFVRKPLHSLVSTILREPRGLGK
jgi:hypothetical protein